jgi:hypothetical protein
LSSFCHTNGYINKKRLNQDYASFIACLGLAFIGCASTVRQAEPVAETLELPQCHAGEFRGIGTGESDNEALAEAHSALAMQISSSVNVTIERTVNQRVSGGREDLNTGYESNTVIESSLPNAHDARIAGSIRGGGKTSVAVCMTKADAAKGFIERQRLFMDSLEMASNTALAAEHPKHKNEAWHRTQMLYNDFMRIQHLLEGWGVGSPYSADEVYAKIADNYKDYCKNQKIYWTDAKDECSKAVFAELSKKVNIEESNCSIGLNLNFFCSEECKSTSLGIKCSFEPSLVIESCNGEPYSRLSAKEPPTGSDRHSESSAKEKLIKNLPQAAFLEEWKMEIKKWEPQCIK